MTERMISVPESELREVLDPGVGSVAVLARARLRRLLPATRPSWTLETTGYKLTLSASNRSDEFVAHMENISLRPGSVGVTRESVEELRDTCTEILGDGEPVECEVIPAATIKECAGKRYSDGPLIDHTTKFVRLTPEIERRLSAKLPRPRRGAVICYEDKELARDPEHTAFVVWNEHRAEARARLRGES